MPTPTPANDSPRALATRGRILQAAREEFAAAGFGGGRVDKVAAAAGVNKERIYAYYGDKQALFAAAIGSAVAEVAQSLSEDVDDLTALAERLYDFMESHPDTLRLLTWARLETNPWAEAAQHVGTFPEPQELIGRWQADGDIDAGWDPRDLFVLIWGVCEIWHIAPFRAEGLGADAVSDRRRNVVSAITRTIATLSAPAR